MSVWRWLALVLLVPSVAWASSAEPVNDLTDEAEVFSKAAEDEAAKIQAEIRKLKQSFVVETLARPPEPPPEEAKERATYFGNLAVERAKLREVKGVYLLYTKEPSHFEVLVSKSTTEKAFTDKDRAELNALLEKEFKAGAYDRALVDAGKLVRDRMQTNVGATASKPAESGWAYWGSLFLILAIATWVVIAAIRAIFTGGIGSGFMPAFWSALLGATVGLWLYENVLSKQSSSGSEKTEETSAGGDNEYAGGGEGKDV